MLARSCGPEAKAAILSRDCGLRRGAALRLSRLPVADQQRIIGLLLTHGKLPRGINGAASTITLPMQPDPFAAKLLDRVGGDHGRAIYAALGEALRQSVAMT